MTLRMTIAKTEMTMLFPTLSVYFLSPPVCCSYHVHALKADTTGFMFAGSVEVLPYRRVEEVMGGR